MKPAVIILLITTFVGCVLFSYGNAQAGPQTISAGMSHSIGLKTNQSILAWGRNHYGQVGDNTVVERRTPIYIGSGYSSVSAGSLRSFGLKADGSLFAWGYNWDGQLGDGTTTDRHRPVQVGSGYRIISAGAAHTLALKTNGTLWAWGNNIWSQLGDPTTVGTDQSSPVYIGSGYTAIAAGWFHSLGLKTDGTLWAWGSNWDGQVGDNTLDTKGSPVQIGSGFNSIAVGDHHSFGLKSGGELWAWGNNQNGQLGDGSTLDKLIPTRIGSGYVSIAGGAAHTIGLKIDGTLWAWGANDKGQLGDGTTSDRHAPVQVGSGFGVIAAGGDHSLAVKTDGTLWAWGSNEYGQLGDGTTLDRHQPVQVGTGFDAGVSSTPSSPNLMPILSFLLDESGGAPFSWGTDAHGSISGTTDQSNHKFAGFLSRFLCTANSLADSDPDNDESLVPYFFNSVRFNGFEATLGTLNVQYYTATQYDDVNDQDILVIMFQGTRELSDWIYNTDATSSEFFNTGTTVHRGFQTLTEFFVNGPYQDPTLTFRTASSNIDVTLDEYFQRVKAKQESPVVFVMGNSLGGALATLFGAYLIENELISPDNLSVYTTAAPPAGGSNFVNRYQARSNQYNVINLRDLVPYSSNICGGYQRLGQPLIFDGLEGDVIEDLGLSCVGAANYITDNFSSLRSRHSLWSTYISIYFPEYSSW